MSELQLQTITWLNITKNGELKKTETQSIYGVILLTENPRNAN